VPAGRRDRARVFQVGAQSLGHHRRHAEPGGDILDIGGRVVRDPSQNDQVPPALDHTAACRRAPRPPGSRARARAAVRPPRGALTPPSRRRAKSDACPGRSVALPPAGACGPKRKPPRFPGGLPHGAEPLGLVRPLHASPTPERLVSQGRLILERRHRCDTLSSASSVLLECASLLVEKNPMMLKSRRYLLTRHYDNALR
jgi:hypothetical protein